MESKVFDNVRFEKEKAIARFNRFRRIVKLWQFFEVLVVFGMISWSSARVPAVLKIMGRCFVEFSTYLFNHHVVFLIGNVIIVILFVICRQSDTVSLSGCDDFYNDYTKHSEAGHQREPTPTPPPPTHPREPTLPPPLLTPGTVDATEAADGSGYDMKQIVVCTEESMAISQCDDVAMAIEKATRQIMRFQRTQSEKLKREISVRPRPELRRSETENYRRTSNPGERLESEPLETAEIETLSSEEFQRTVDAFIDKHWSKKKTKSNNLENYENYHLSITKTDIIMV